MTNSTLMLRNAVIRNAAAITTYETALFGHCLYIDQSALRISASTPARMPLKAYCTSRTLWNALRTKEMPKMMRKEGSTTPSVASSAPRKPHTRKPTKVAALTAIGPGVDSAMATISRTSSSVIQPRFSVISF